MAHFYGTVQGSRGKASRVGTRVSGLGTVAAGWKGAIRVEISERDGKDWYRVTLEPWEGSGGGMTVLAEGELDSALATAMAAAAIGEDAD